MSVPIPLNPNASDILSYHFVITAPLLNDQDYEFYLHTRGREVLPTLE